ncbi:hypothetical protein EDD99_7153 [Streptomyces sp. 846.5]|nr:DUF6879 family protein [Streptomyces sp. 846.5]TDT95328.1 hypothetical protein EDD99_7153 [Streptomyces sp. 846.5]
MVEIIPFADIGHLFEDFQHTAWRLESRRGYASDLTGERLARFLATGGVPADPSHPWQVNIRAQLSQGKTFGRVRVVDDPLTDNQRFLLATALDSPEDIRMLPRTRADQLHLPREDFWLFDSATLVRLVFDEDTDRTLGVVLIEDASEVLRACQVRDAAQHFAVPAREFNTAVPSAM